MWSSISLLIGVVAAVAACGAPSAAIDSDAGDAAMPSFGDGTAGFPDDASIGVQARYVLGGCVGGPEAACHGPGRAVEGLMLPDTDPTNLVDVPSTEVPAIVRVRRGDPLESYLYLKVIGSPRIEGVRMPKDSPPLDARSLAVIATWIDAGAP